MKRSLRLYIVLNHHIELEFYVKTVALLPQTVISAAFDYLVLVLWFSCSQRFFKIIWVSNLLTLSVPDEGYSRNTTCTLN